MVEKIKELKKICYKCSSKKRPLYMEKVTMKLSIYVTKFLLSIGVRADQVSISMVLLVILGAGMIGFGSLWTMFIGISIIHFTVILDNVNGEVARYRKEGNLTGTFLEETYHILSIPFIYFSLGFGIFMHTGLISAVILGFLASVFVSPVIINTIKIAVVKKGIDRLKEKKKMLPERYTLLKEKVNIEGGSTESGTKLYKLYETIKELWGFPANIVHIHIIIIIELLNSYYYFAPEFLIPLIYLGVYSVIAVMKQIASFIVHYKGKTVFHYYNALFGKK